MGLSLFQSIHWAASFLVETAVLAVALRRSVFKQLPIFVAYLALLVTSESARWIAYEFTGIGSRISFDTYWTTQAILILCRAAVVYEICHSLLSPYTGIWKLCRPLLITLGLVLAGSAAA